MAKCCASAGANCACVFESGQGTTRRGAGTQGDPYRYDIDDNYYEGETGQQFATSKGGFPGQRTFKVDYSPTATLDGLPDVAAPAPAAGDVLTWDGTQWVSSPPGAAAPGTVNRNQTLTGDGSAGAPLAVAHHVDRYTGTFAGGIGINDDGLNRMVMHYANDAARAASTVVPEVNALSMLDTDAGTLWFWNGTDWRLVQTPEGQADDVIAEFTGPKSAFVPLIPVTRNIVGTGATFEMFSPALDPDRDGVASAWVTVNGTTPLIATVTVAGGVVTGNLWRVDGTAYTGAFDVTVNGWLY